MTASRFLNLPFFSYFLCQIMENNGLDDTTKRMIILCPTDLLLGQY